MLILNSWITWEELNTAYFWLFLVLKIYWLTLVICFVSCGPLVSNLSSAQESQEQSCKLVGGIRLCGICLPFVLKLNCSTSVILISMCWWVVTAQQTRSITRHFWPCSSVLQFKLRLGGGPQVRILSGSEWAKHSKCEWFPQAFWERDTPELVMMGEW